MQLLEGDPCRAIDLDPAHAQPELIGDSLDQVTVGREVVSVDDQLRARGVTIKLIGHGRANELVEHDRCRITDDGLAGCGTEGGAGQRIPNTVREFEPLFIPAANESGAPIVLHKIGDALDARQQRPTERVPVEVGLRGSGHRLVNPDKALTVARQGI